MGELDEIVEVYRAYLTRDRSNLTREEAVRRILPRAMRYDGLGRNHAMAFSLQNPQPQQIRAFFLESRRCEAEPQTSLERVLASIDAARDEHPHESSAGLRGSGAYE